MRDCVCEEDDGVMVIGDADRLLSEKNSKISQDDFYGVFRKNGMR